MAASAWRDPACDLRPAATDEVQEQPAATATAAAILTAISCTPGLIWAFDAATHVVGKMWRMGAADGAPRQVGQNIGLQCGEKSGHGWLSVGVV